MKQIITVFFLIFISLPVFASTYNSDPKCDDGYSFHYDDAWATIYEHGFCAFDQGTDGCTRCHGENFNNKGTKSCYSCHAAFPHSSDWANYTSHGAFALKNGVDKSCKRACHSGEMKTDDDPKTDVDDFEGGYSLVTCYKCHAPFPHKSQDGIAWKEPHGHGLYALNNGIEENCQVVCHGSDYKGGDSGVACYSCHAPFPHQPKDDVPWKDPTVHGVFAVENGGVEANCQNTCHGTDYEGGDVGVRCYDCHSVFPHSEEWADPEKRASSEFHGRYVLNVNAIDTRACATQCHGGNYKGGLSGVACGSCHNAYPHAYGWSRPQVHGVFAAENGVEASCGIGCHGDNYEGGNSGISCYTCHADFPHAEDYVVNHEDLSAEAAEGCQTLCHSTYSPEELGCTAPCHE